MKRKGFTIIELLVVITLIGVLSAAVTVFINPVKRQKQARDARRKHDITAIAQALSSFSTLRGYAPAENLCDTSIGETDQPFNICVTNQSYNCGASQSGGYPGGVWEDDGDDWIYQNLITDKDLIKRLPLDPINNSTYYYLYEPAPPNAVSGCCENPSTGCATFWIGALLEDPQDPNKAIFRCSDNKDLAEGIGCKEVTGTSMAGTDNVP